MLKGCDIAPLESPPETFEKPGVATPLKGRQRGKGIKLKCKRDEMCVENGRKLSIPSSLSLSLSVSLHLAPRSLYKRGIFVGN